MPTLRSDDAVLYYEVSGSGPDLVLLHPFPLNHHFWDGVIPTLRGRYRVITPDLRGHGDSELRKGAATMEKHAATCSSLPSRRVSKATFGRPIGGYVLFEFWR